MLVQVASKSYSYTLVQIGAPLEASRALCVPAASERLVPHRCETPNQQPFLWSQCLEAHSVDPRLTRRWAPFKCDARRRPPSPRRRMDNETPRSQSNSETEARRSQVRWCRRMPSSDQGGKSSIWRRMHQRASLKRVLLWPVR